jgi:long-subunit fatty acid transport protein
MRPHAAVALFVLLTGVPVVRANPEASFLSDARSVALGGVGVASADYASSVWHNPAGLSSVRKLSITGTLLPLLTRVDSPFPNPTTGEGEQVIGEWQLGGLGTVAAGYRVHERVTLGFATYIFSGNSVRFDNAVAKEHVSASSFAGELQLPISVEVTKRLSLGAAYRITFSRITTDLPVPFPPPAMGLALTDTKLSGWNFAGFAFGVRYRFNDAFRAGLLYRTKVVVDLDGDTKSTVQGETSKTPTAAEYPLPHTFKLGSELRLLDRRLVLAADLSVWLFKESHPQNVRLGRPADWDNAVRLNMGGEYTFQERIGVRAGFYVGNSATSDAAATQFAVAPNVLYAFSAGAGIKLRERFDLDFAIAYAGSIHRAVSPEVNALAAGNYGGHGIFWGVSLNCGI